MATKHTPGPWTMKESSQTQEWAYWIDTMSPAIAERQRGIAGVLNSGPERSEANARLIAAAPEMFEALGRIANEMQSASSQGDPVGPAWLDRRIKLARKALAALGEGR